MKKQKAKPMVEPRHEGHPLFPRRAGVSGPDLRRIDLIIIHRWLSDGTKEVCPKVWSAAELVSWDQIRDLYGGECTYQGIGQCAKTRRFQAFSEQRFIDGTPRKPFFVEPEPHTSSPHEHPLFPDAEVGADIRIHVLVRRPDGGWDVCGPSWKGSALRSWSQILAQHGAEKTFRLLAECATSGELQAWAEATFRGGPRAISSPQTRKAMS